MPILVAPEDKILIENAAAEKSLSASSFCRSLILEKIKTGDEHEQ